MSAEDFAIVREAREWLERSRNSKSPSIAKLHATTLLAALDRLEARLAEVEKERDGYKKAANYIASREAVAEAAEARVAELEEGK